ncbi:1-(5-phosphoribosyl)-5-[(5-phosphoribosylamino)methylideneamino]imidazole-4-carboxamide isomerase [Pontibacillus salicampi]|uniref:1-(5-phosphoribosyl)-5-[(5-phosphoribosylamino)methylideneamino] imidazole-4-carboxamide isomerase n=1 Tax=Pontibacillus salicampi TaxID=1449801 RepID=A0ABV6LTB9_9BACI
MSTFTIYPAIDMKEGKCVRLLQGDFDKETVYGDSPFEVAKEFVANGAEWIHMVDLDGARDGNRANAEHVVRVAKELDVKVQMGGGIRSRSDVEYYLERGVDRVIIGSLAIADPELTKELVAHYGERIAIGLDARDGFAATEGWLNKSDKKATEVGKYFADAGVETFVYTDIAKDGMMNGPNTESIVEMAEITGKNVIASGGVSKLSDLQDLKQYADRNVAGAIVGKAIYTKEIRLQEAIQEVSQ